ncbi:MAG: helix-turn-helix domain-containing protein [Oscillospiraceae bacterium]
MTNNMIGDVLKRTRTIYGYKANEMSSALGISASYLSEIENNKKQPSLELLEKYADIYGIRLSSLILLSESMEDAEKAGKGTAFIRNMMAHLIQSMSKTASDPDEE